MHGLSTNTAADVSAHALIALINCDYGRKLIEDPILTNLSMSSVSLVQDIQYTLTFENLSTLFSLILNF